MVNHSSIIGNWNYSSIDDLFLFYNDLGLIYNVETNRQKLLLIDKKTVVRVNQDDKGNHHLLIGDANETEEKVHIFIVQSFFTQLKYWFLKYLNSNWTEVKLYRKEVSNSVENIKNIKILIDNRGVENLEKIKSLFEFVFRRQNSIKMPFKLKRFHSILQEANSKHLNLMREKEEKIDSCKSYPILVDLIREWFANRLDGKLEDEEIDYSQSQVSKFCEWYKKNYRLSLTIPNNTDDLLSSEFQQKIIEKLNFSFDQINQLSDKFIFIKNKLKKEFAEEVIKYFENYPSAEDLTGESKETCKKLLEHYKDNFFEAISEKFSSTDAELIIQELHSSWNICFYRSETLTWLITPKS